MNKGRIEAFSDGVIAIIITIMVLEFKRPDGISLAALLPVAPQVAIYALSFVYVGIYWNNHHHLFHIVKGVSGTVLWANLHLLFWLSLVPFVTAWMGENYLSPWPVALYGAVLLLCGLAYALLERALIAREGAASPLAKAVGADWKGWLSLVAYAAAIAAAFVWPPASLMLFAAVALAWLIPDPRIEKEIARL
jgi:uncharacterized membrane protein